MACDEAHLIIHPQSLNTVGFILQRSPERRLERRSKLRTQSREVLFKMVHEHAKGGAYRLPFFFRFEGVRVHVLIFALCALW